MYFYKMDNKGENIPEPGAKKFGFDLLQVTGIVALAITFSIAIGDR